MAAARTAVTLAGEIITSSLYNDPKAILKAEIKIEQRILIYNNLKLVINILK